MQDGLAMQDIQPAAPIALICIMCRAAAPLLLLHTRLNSCRTCRVFLMY
jgi:hypothetical protein